MKYWISFFRYCRSSLQILGAAIFLSLMIWSLGDLINAFKGAYEQSICHKQIISAAANLGLNLGGSSIVIDNEQIYLEAVEDYDIWEEKIFEYGFYFIVGCFGYMLLSTPQHLSIIKRIFRCRNTAHKIIAKSNFLRFSFISFPSFIWVLPFTRICLITFALAMIGRISQKNHKAWYFFMPLFILVINVIVLIVFLIISFREYGFGESFIYVFVVLHFFWFLLCDNLVRDKYLNI